MSKEDSYFRLAVTNHSENYFKNKEKKQHYPEYSNTGIEKNNPTRVTSLYQKKNN